MSQKDGLTGIYNRVGFMEKLDEAFAQAASNQEDLSLVVFDIDSFKAFNDTYGHIAGDELIKHIADVINEIFGENGLVARYGGEEFAAAVPNSPPTKAFELAEEVRKTIADGEFTFTTEEGEKATEVTISGGLASYPSDARELKELIRKAEQGMYLAKETGRNRICPYEEKDGLTGLLNRYAISLKLDEAIEFASQHRGSVSLISFDLNYFKEINDEHGHLFGDEVLKRVASVLHENFKGENLVGRYGGDEFLVVLPNSRAETAFVLAEEVRKLIADTELVISVGEQTSRFQVGVSGGVAAYPTDGRERIDLIRKATEALYRAKQIGRDRICLPTDSQMITKTSHFTQTQLERLSGLAKAQSKSEAFFLREALDDLMRKYDDSLKVPNIEDR